MIPYLSSAQDKYSCLVITVRSEVALCWDSAAMYKSATIIPSGTIVLGSSFYNYQGYGVWHIANGDKDGYIIDDSTSLLYNSENADKIRKLGTSGDGDRIKFALQTSPMVNKKLADMKKKQQSMAFGIEWAWGYENDYSYSAYVNFSIKNYSSKRIKYAKIWVSAKNPVGDQLTSFGNKLVPLNGIGPVGPDERSSWEFESAFHSKLIETMRIVKIQITYFDGTVKVVTDPTPYLE